MFSTSVYALWAEFVIWNLVQTPFARIAIEASDLVPALQLHDCTGPGQTNLTVTSCSHRARGSWPFR